MKRIYLKIEAESGNAAFQENTQHELADVVFGIAEFIREGSYEEGGPIRDRNGNTVGAWMVKIENYPDA